MLTPGNCGPDLRDLRLAQRSAANCPRLSGVAAGTNPTGAALRICSEATAEARRQPRQLWPVSLLAAEDGAVLGGKLRKGPRLASGQPGHLISDPSGVAVRHHDVELDQPLDQPTGQASANQRLPEGVGRDIDGADLAAGGRRQPLGHLIPDRASGPVSAYALPWWPGLVSTWAATAATSRVSM